MSSFIVGFAIRDKGVSVTTFAPTPETPSATTQAMMSMKPLRADLFSHLPAGAYGLWAISDSDKYYDALKGLAPMGAGEGRKALDDADDSFKKEFGLSIEEAVRGTLSGDAVVALYPLPGAVEGGDLLIELDDSNGATPAAITEEDSRRIDAESQEHSRQDAGLRRINLRRSAHRDTC